MINVSEKFEALPSEFHRSAIPLTTLGIAELAWKHKHIHEVIDWLTCNRLSILGGDVYKLENSEITSAYCDWFVQRKARESWDEYTARGAKKAKDYIRYFHEKCGENYCYSLVFVSESDFLLLHN